MAGKMGRSGGYRSGAGRKPGAETEWVDPKPDSWFWVEGRVVISGHDPKKKVIRDKVIEQLGLLGLTPHIAPVVPGEDTPRRRWAHKRLSADEVFDIVAAHPGANVSLLAREAYSKPNTAWTAVEQKHAEGKMFVMLGKLRNAGRITRGLDAEGRVSYTAIKKPKAAPRDLKWKSE